MTPDNGSSKQRSQKSDDPKAVPRMPRELRQALQTKFKTGKTLFVVDLSFNRKIEVLRELALKFAQSAGMNSHIHFLV